MKRKKLTRRRKKALSKMLKIDLTGKSKTEIALIVTEAIKEKGKICA